MPVHSIAPVFSSTSRVLILGSFPSVRSRGEGFFYAHPRNRFWRVLAAVYGQERVPETIEEKTAFLLDRGIALWDVIASCELTASSDASIRNAEPNDLSVILDAADIRAIFCNGAKAYELYERHLHRQTGREAIRLPSTSPANAARSLEQLTEAWRAILI